VNAAPHPPAVVENAPAVIVRYESGQTRITLECNGEIPKRPQSGLLHFEFRQLFERQRSIINPTLKIERDRPRSLGKCHSDNRDLGMIEFIDYSESIG
jgi:hypothetical protein